MGILEGWVLKLLDLYFCLGVPAMEHSRIFVPTSCPDQTWPCHAEQVISHSCLFVETVWRFSEVRFIGGKDECDWPDKSGKKAREQALIPEELAETWHSCLNPSLPFRGSLIQAWRVRRSKNVSQQRKLGHDCREEVKWWRAELSEKRAPRQTPGRQNGPFLGQPLNISSCISIRTSLIQNLKLKMLPSPRVFWALAWLSGKFYSWPCVIRQSEHSSTKTTM